MTAEEQQLLREAESRIAKRRERLEEKIPAAFQAEPVGRKGDMLARLKRTIEDRLGPGRLQRAFAAGDRAGVREHQPRELTAEEVEERTRSALRLAEVPAAYLACSRESWRDPWKGRPCAWPAPADEWGGRPWSLTLKGPPGTGKTHVAVSVMRRWIAKRGPSRVRFISVPAAVRDIREQYATPKGKECIPIWGKPPAVFYRWVAQTWPFVIFDDIGAQPDRENWLTEVSGWLYDRHAKQLPTVVTLNPGDYRGLEERASRRLADGLVIEMQ